MQPHDSKKSISDMLLTKNFNLFLGCQGRPHSKLCHGHRANALIRAPVASILTRTMRCQPLMRSALICMLLFDRTTGSCYHADKDSHESEWKIMLMPSKALILSYSSLPFTSVHFI
eukprot:scaffold285612_cov19-Prasinocladus_malaysianus.AAC.1